MNRNLCLVFSTLCLLCTGCEPTSPPPQQSRNDNASAPGEQPAAEGTAGPYLEVFVENTTDSAATQMIQYQGEAVRIGSHPIATNNDILALQWTKTNQGDPAISLQLDEETTQQMLRATEGDRGERRMLFLVDGRPAAAPYINSQIGSNLIIFGSNVDLDELYSRLNDDLPKSAISSDSSE